MRNTTEDHDSYGPDKVSIWIVYVIINLIGTLLCSGIIISILRTRNLIQKDYSVIGLCFGCLLMSIPCFIECLINLTKNWTDSDYPDTTCDIQAMFHLIAMTIQFFFTSLIAITSCITIVYRKNMFLLQKTYRIIYASILLLAIIGSATFGSLSETIMLKSGTWCFYKFTSITITAWFTPSVILTALSIIISYLKIFITIKKSKNSVKPYLTATTATNDLPTKIAKKASIFVLAFLICWTPLIIASFIELSGHPITETFDITIMTLGSFNSILVAFIYGSKKNTQNNSTIHLHRKPITITIEVKSNSS